MEKTLLDDGMNKWFKLLLVLLSVTIIAPQTGCGQEASSSRREPVVRRMTEAQAHVQARIEFYRDKLPEELHGRRNFAWAAAIIEGVEKWEYYAHSGVNELADVPDDAAALMGGPRSE